MTTHLQNEATLTAYIGLNDVANKHSRVQLDGSAMTASKWATGMPRHTRTHTQLLLDAIRPKLHGSIFLVASS